MFQPFLSPNPPSSWFASARPRLECQAKGLFVKSFATNQFHRQCQWLWLIVLVVVEHSVTGGFH